MSPRLKFFKPPNITTCVSGKLKAKKSSDNKNKQKKNIFLIRSSGENFWKKNYEMSQNKHSVYATNRTKALVFPSLKIYKTTFFWSEEREEKKSGTSSRSKKSPVYLLLLLSVSSSDNLYIPVWWLWLITFAKIQSGVPGVTLIAAKSFGLAAPGAWNSPVDCT